mmetsp:Transcript_32792/g.71597  ORF Transcript_32792/g.71597 Transcript_32792/m.71597 type:complete len:218 (-) Transcript_32792:59-712(-)
MADVAFTYWAGRGKCEPLRCIVAAGGGKFENKFVGGKADWEAVKASGKLAYNQAPLAETDGLNLVQSQAAAIYLSKKYGLYPTDPKEEYLVQMVFNATVDARSPFIGIPFGGDVEKACQGLGRYLLVWSKMLESSGPFFLGEKASLADVAVFEVMDAVEEYASKEKIDALIAPFPKLVDLRGAVLKLGRLADWCLVERPKLFLPHDEYVKVVRASFA